jgi:hypothetical protein
LYKNHNNVTPSVENQDQMDTCEVVMDTTTSSDNPGQRVSGAFEHAGNDSVKTIIKRPAARASMCAPAITASGKTCPTAINEKQAALKVLLDRGAKTRSLDVDANTDASFTSLFAPVAKDAADAENNEENTPYLNVADIPANVSLASIAAARTATNVSKNRAKQKTGIANAEENERSNKTETANTPVSSNASEGNTSSANSLLSRFRVF